MLQYLISAAALLICSVTDLRFKKISRIVAAIYFVLLLAAHLLLADTGLPAEGPSAGDFFTAGVSAGAQSAGGLLSCLLYIACGALPGLLFLLLGRLTEQAIGYGDGVLILLLGCSLGFWQCLGALLFAFLMAGVFGAVLVIIKKGTGTSRIAFVPFLLAGVLLQGLLLYAP